MALPKKENLPSFKLVVRSNFNQYQRGEEIVDPIEIKNILESPAIHSVIKVSTSTEE